MQGGSCAGAAGIPQGVPFCLLPSVLPHLSCMCAQAEAERKAREDIELQAATFRPEITQLAKKMQWQQHGRNGSGEQGAGATAGDAKWARLSTAAFRKSTLVSTLSLELDRTAPLGVLAYGVASYVHV